MEAANNATQQVHQTDSAQSLTYVIQPSRLLNLPAEIRNEVWALAATHGANADENANVDLLTIPKFGVSLLRICIQTNAEAKGLFQDAQAQYRRNKNFVIEVTRDDFDTLLQKLNALRQDDVKHIRKLTIQGTIRGRRHDWVFKDGVWTMTDDISASRASSGFGCLMPPATARNGFSKDLTNSRLRA